MEEDNLVKNLVETPSKNSFWREVFLPAVIILVIILAGGVSGWFLSQKVGKEGLKSTSFIGETQKIEKKEGVKEMGVKDPKTFKDQAFGRIEKNDNSEIPEGSHKLIRPGGPSQTAYLTSSVVDLNLFLGKCVEVWGETFAAQKAGWLMDVGYVKVLNSCPEGL